MRDELDALAKTVEGYKNLESLRNTSGTGRVVVGGLAMFGTVNPVMLPMIAMKGLAARVMAQSLAKPVTVRAINRQAVAFYNFLESGKGEAVLKLATLTMAKKIADATGADEKDVTNTVKGNLAPVFGTEQQPRTRQLGTGGARP